MIEPQLGFESISFFWAIAFLIDVLNGMMFFLIAVKGLHRKGYDKMLWWLGWWSCVEACTLLINIIIGPYAPFSYHQFGIVTGMAIYIGMFTFSARIIIENYCMKDEDWNDFYKIIRRAQMRYIREKTMCDENIED